MKKERKEDSFIKQPYYIGGDKALSAFINQNLKYPEISQANKIEGDVHIRFDINHKGDVIDAKVIGGLDEACNDEALRVVKLLKYAVPKTPRRLKVTFHKNIRIHFRINSLQSKQILTEEHVSENTSNKGLQINYNIVLSPSLPKEEKHKTNPTYNYSIKI